MFFLIFNLMRRTFPIGNLRKIFAERKEELKPGEGILSVKDWYRSFYNCKHTALKLAVIKVKFANGKGCN